VDDRAVLPLDDFCREAGIGPEDYKPVYWNAVTYRGHIWALPSTPATTALHFNTAMMRRVGLDPNRPPRTIPFELSEAAKIDGASEWRVFRDVVLPLCKPAIAVVALFSFMGTWNDSLGPLIYLLDQKTFTLALGLQFYQSQHGGTQWNLLMAASTIVVAPVIVLFFFTQRLFIQGIALTGLK